MEAACASSSDDARVLRRDDVVARLPANERSRENFSVVRRYVDANDVAIVDARKHGLRAELRIVEPGAHGVTVDPNHSEPLEPKPDARSMNVIARNFSRR